MRAISPSSAEWLDVGFFLPTVYLKTLSIVAIFFKDLQESVFEKHLSPNWWWVGGGCSSQLKKTLKKGCVIFYFFFQDLWTLREKRGKFRDEKRQETERDRW